MKLIFEHIYEDDRELIFDPPITIEIFEIDEKEGCAYAEWDFGMNDDIYFKAPWTNHISTAKEKIVKAVEFNLFHAFFHYEQDPNYTFYHWALAGNLKERTKKVENY